MSYASLFEPLRIANKLSLTNRLVMAPMTTVSGEYDGAFSSEEIAYLARRAASGIGLIMTPACYCHKSGHSFERQVGCHLDSLIPSLERCAEGINRFGAASFLQIHHGGNAARKEFAGRPPIAPSAVHNRRGTSELPNAMTESEISMIIEAFSRAAGRAKRAGFTGIELHGANTYLFQQFFSPFTNKRDDAWGGDCRCDHCDRHEQHDSIDLCHRLSNRARFASEVIKAVRSEVGNNFPISYRVSPEEPEPDGYTTYDTIELLRLIVPLGIDFVHVSSWEYGVGLYTHYPSGTHPTLLIRQALPSQVAVIGVGSIVHPDQALRVLADGVELAALGRALLLDPDWALKVRDGKVASVQTALDSEEDRHRLEIPKPMQEYTKRSILVRSQ